MGDLFEDDIPDTAIAVNDRIFAAVLDLLFFAVMMVVYMLIFSRKIEPEIDGGPTIYAVTGILGIVPIVVWILYFIVLEFLLQGTPGKKLMKLCVISLDHQRVKFFQVVQRHLCDIIDYFWCLGFMGIILMKNTKNNQRLGDIWAKTIVIRAGNT